MKPHKFHAKATACRQSHPHPSKREARRCDELHLMLRADVIGGLVYEPQYWFEINGEQVKHPNGRRVGYKPDFAYIEQGKIVCEDVKGMITPDATLRMTLFRHLFPDIELRIVK